MDDNLLELRKTLIQSVIADIATGTEPKDACKKANISRKTLSRYMREYPELTVAVKTAHADIIRERLNQVVNARLGLIDKIIAKAEDLDELSLKEIVMLQKQLKDIQVEISGNAPPPTGTSEKGILPSFLSASPQLKKATLEFESPNGDREIIEGVTN